VLSHRAAVNLWRNPALLRAHAIITVVVAVFIGVVFLKLQNDIAGFQNRLGLIFFSLLLFAFACLSAVDLFIGDRIIFKKERANGCYKTSAYYCASMFSDLLPLRIVFPLIYAIVVYWMASFVGDAEHFLKFILVFLLFNMVSAAMFYVISVSVPSVTVGNIVSAAILLFLMLFSGFLLNFASIPVWLIWLRYLSFFSYAFEALTANELEGLQLELGVEGFGSVNISANVFLVAFNLSSENYWRNVGILAGMAIALNILAYILLRFVRKPKQ
jgi:ABC-type multidrug transport system permease subunit